MVLVRMLAFVLLCVPVATVPAGAVIEPKQDSDTAGLARARALFDQASAMVDREDLTGAEPPLREAVEIQRKFAPGSIDLAKSLTALGNVMRARFDLKGAEPLLRAYRAVFLGEPEKSIASWSDVTGSTKWPIILLLGFLLFAGFVPSYFLAFITPTIEALLR